MTEREVVLRERAAFEAGARFHFEEECRAAWRCRGTYHRGINYVVVSDEATKRYALPTVTRPRVVRDAHNQDREWRVVQGRIETRTPYGSAWHDANNGTLEQPGWMPERVKLLADLLANPTETVPEDA